LLGLLLLSGWDVLEEGEGGQSSQSSQSAHLKNCRARFFSNSPSSEERSASMSVAGTL
jgi:hypothetical protein